MLKIQIKNVQIGKGWGEMRRGWVKTLFLRSSVLLTKANIILRRALAYSYCPTNNSNEYRTKLKCRFSACALEQQKKSICTTKRSFKLSRTTDTMMTTRTWGQLDDFFVFFADLSQWVKFDCFHFHSSVITHVPWILVAAAAGLDAD